MKNKDRYAKIFMDTIEFNYSFTSTAFYQFSKFIYLIRNPKQSLGNMIKEGYSQESAESYYLFRLRRMYEMAYRTPGSLFLQYQDMNKGRQLLADFLGVESIPPIKTEEELTETWISDKGYEKYLKMFKKLPLKMLNTACNLEGG